MKTQNNITVIEGSGDVLAGGHPALFAVHSKHFASVDHYVAYKKAELFRDVVAANRIWGTSDPLEVNSLSKTVKGFDAGNWARHRPGIADMATLAKFDQNPEMAQVLLATGASTLVVANSVNGQRGITLGANDPNIFDESKWVGLNLEGKALMRARTIFQNRLKPKETNWDATPEPVSIAYKIDMCSSWAAGFCMVVPQEHWLPDLQRLPPEQLKAELCKYMHEIRFQPREVDPACHGFLIWVDETFGFELDWPIPQQIPDNAKI